jgi:uncharacterized protein
MSDTGELTKAQYIALTTFKRDGTPVATPIWLASTDVAGRFVAYTDADAGKAKRIRATGRVTAQVCSSSGKVKADARTYEGTARMIDGAAAERAEQLISKKYGWKKSAFEAVMKIGRVVRRKPEPASAYIEFDLA